MKKICLDCKEQKNISNFYLQSNKKYYFSYCKKCWYLRYSKKGKYKDKWYVYLSPRKRYASNIKMLEKIREQDKKYQQQKRKKYPKLNQIEWERYKLTYPERIRANIILRRAVKRKIIKKPDKCSECNQKKQIKDIHGHHDDWNEPLNIRWLCPSCHKKAHLVVKHYQ